MKKIIKYGLIGAGLFLVLAIIFFVLSGSCITIKGAPCSQMYNSNNETAKYNSGICYTEKLKECNIYFVPMNYLSSFPLLLIVNPNSYLDTANGGVWLDISIFLDVLITGFIIGAIVGLIIKKIRKK